MDTQNEWFGKGNSLQKWRHVWYRQVRFLES